ncbi:MAG: hypothetical protein JWM91_295 [Rhodospirillales bacterium]|nr:hypothetical protein [Rhodospirillales bacterium]
MEIADAVGAGFVGKDVGDAAAENLARDSHRAARIGVTNGNDRQVGASTSTSTRYKPGKPTKTARKSTGEQHRDRPSSGGGGHWNAPFDLSPLDPIPHGHSWPAIVRSRNGNPMHRP